MAVVKTLLTILLLFSIHSGFPQKASENFSAIDREVKFIHAAEPESLAQQLSSLGKTNKEKVRAIFSWIAGHIDYNAKIFEKNKRPAPSVLIYEEPDDTTTVLKSLNERVAAKVLRKKTAVCDGYTRLFKTLCDYTGIRSEIISGYARTNINRTSSRFGVNHTWNAVYLDSSWYLLDVTWASGFISYSNEFVRQFDDFYFLTPPQYFIRDHYPEDTAWTLMKDPPAYREFYNSPFRYSAFRKSGIISYFPSKGIIEAGVGDTVKFELKTNTENRTYYVTDIPQSDSPAALPSSADAQKKESISFSYVVTGSSGNWLYVYCNDEIVMRYKLKVKKENDLASDKLPTDLNH